jgi:hypothetical protein
MIGKPARIELSNGDEDVFFLVNGTAALANGSDTPVMASCHLREDLPAGTRNFGDAWVTIPGALGDPGVASVAMTGWTVLMGGTVSTVTVECNQPIAAATVTGTRSAVFIVQ